MDKRVNRDTLGILFLHHGTDPVTLNNLESIRRMNPDATIVTMSAGVPLPSGYSVEATPKLKQLHSEQRENSSDRLVCSWFIQRKETCDKWWITEWDAHCTMSVREYYRPVWQFPFVASSVRLRHREPEWVWFKNLEKIPFGYRSYVSGIVPFLCLISDEALSSVCTMLLAEPFSMGNGELRFATAATRCGYAPCGFSPPKDQITWMIRKEIPSRPTIAHPIKHIPNSTGPSAIDKIGNGRPKMRIAIFQNFLDTIGGAEIVGLILARELDADIYTTNIDREKLISMGFTDLRIHSIGRVPVNAPFRQQMTSWRFRRLNLKNEYDFFIVNGDWAVSGAVNNKPNLWYVNATIRELYDLRDYVRKNMMNAFKRPIFDIWSWCNKRLNRKHVNHVDAIASNSTFTEDRVKKYLDRKPELVYPPVQTKRLCYGKTGDYWLSVNRLIGYKRVDMQLRAFAAMPDEKLVIVGPYEKSKTSLAYVDLIKKTLPSNVTLIEGAGTFEELSGYYADCKGFITTCLKEDFGLTAVEAMASGKPVIAPNEGGYRETVTNGETGVLIDDIDDIKLAAAVKKLGEELKDPDIQKHYAKKCRRQAEKFDTSVFVEKIKDMTERTADSYAFRVQPGANPPYFSLCTTCMGRFEHLKQTLPVSLSNDDVEVVLVDYSCPEHSGDWAEKIFSKEVRSGKLKIIRVKGRKEYLSSHAKNVSHAHARGSVLINADADNFIDKKYLETCRKILSDSTVEMARAAPWDAKKTVYGMCGRIAIRRSAFRDLGGYDEDMSGYGHDDYDLADRTEAIGFKTVHIPHEMIHVIEHGDNLRTRHMPDRNKWHSVERNMRLSQRNIAAGRLRANRGRIIGSIS